MTALELAGVYIGVHILLLIYLAFRVAGKRGSDKISVGTGGDADMELRMRVHGNATEYIPVTMAGLLAMAATGLPVWTIHAVGISMLVGRLLHALGLSRTILPARILGMLLTWGSMLGVVAALFYTAFT